MNIILYNPNNFSDQDRGNEQHNATKYTHHHACNTIQYSGGDMLTRDPMIRIEWLIACPIIGD